MIDFELEARLDRQAVAEIMADPEMRRLARRAWFSKRKAYELKDKMGAMLEIKRPRLGETS